ncbi:hypothetical protein JM16_009066, partial [Phytophthora kernoviae]
GEIPRSGGLKTKWDLRSMRKSAVKDIKMQEKAMQKEVKRIENLITRGYTLERLATKLGFTKLDDVTKDKNYGFYTKFIVRHDQLKELRKMARVTE